MRYRSTTLLVGWVLVAFLGCKKAPPPTVESKAPPPPADESTNRTESTAANSAPAPAPPSDGRILLRVNWPQGSRHVYRIELDQHSTNQITGATDSTIEDLALGVTYALSALQPRKLKLEILAYELEIKVGGQVRLGFDSTAQSQSNPELAPFHRLIGSRIGLDLDEEGRVSGVSGMSDWMTQVVGDGVGGAEQLLVQQFSDSFVQQLADFGKPLPVNAIQVGQQWSFQNEAPAGAIGVIALDSVLSLECVEPHDHHRYAELQWSGTLASRPGEEVGPTGLIWLNGGSANGSSWFDIDTGTLIESKVDQFMELWGEGPAPPGSGQSAIEFRSRIGQSVTVKLVELQHAP